MEERAAFGVAKQQIFYFHWLEHAGGWRKTWADGKNCRWWETTGQTQNCINGGTIKIRRQVHDTSWEHALAASLPEILSLYHVWQHPETSKCFSLPPFPTNSEYFSFKELCTHTRLFVFYMRVLHLRSSNGFRELVPIVFLEIYCLGPNLQEEMTTLSTKIFVPQCSRVKSS